MPKGGDVRMKVVNLMNFVRQIDERQENSTVQQFEMTAEHFVVKLFRTMKINIMKWLTFILTNSFFNTYNFHSFNFLLS